MEIEATVAVPRGAGADAKVRIWVVDASAPAMIAGDEAPGER
ncbi:hypothetical protein [Streptomyces sp. NPDC007929]